MKTIDEAFADYYLKMARSSEMWLRNRAIKNGVAMDCSVGAFAEGRMVGLTLVGLDDWNGQSAAFDVATGIIPDYRGKKLARKMFDYALPRLRERKVQRFLLEVLQVNQPAITAYQKTGFAITREFDCYDLKRVNYVSRRSDDYAGFVRPIDRAELAPFADQTDWYPSWENSFAGINRIPDEVVVLGAFEGDRLVGEIVYYPLIKWILSLVVSEECRRRGHAQALIHRLLEELGPNWEYVKVTNVWNEDRATAPLLTDCGFTVFTQQYEMAMDL